MRTWRIRQVAAAALCMLLGSAGWVRAARIADIAQVYGIRGNPLYGTGLIVGLDGTGDASLPSAQMLTSLLQREGHISFDPPLAVGEYRSGDGDGGVGAL